MEKKSKLFWSNYVSSLISLITLLALEGFNMGRKAFWGYSQAFIVKVQGSKCSKNLHNIQSQGLKIKCMVHCF